MKITTKTSSKILICLSLVLLAFSSLAHAQSKLEDMRFSRIMVPVDSVTLKSEGIEIRLWGIQPASTSETQLDLRALNLLQNMIGNGNVNCKIMTATDVTKPTARCSTAGGEDLSLKLLEQGLVIRDRRALYGSVFASSYQEAEDLARRNENGIWAFVDTQDKGMIADILEDEEKLAMTAISLILLPFMAMLILGFIVVRSISRLERHQSSQANTHYAKERDLYNKEKKLILQKVETELLENKSRVEAFLTVYQEMLSSIKDAENTPQYQRSGDTVSLQPNFSRIIFNENVSKLSSLDMKLSSELNQFYRDLGDEPEYVELDPSTPREDAIGMVDKIVSKARDYLPHFDHMISKVQGHMRHMD